MILATFQPFERTNHARENYQQVYEYFGFDPIWCVNAESIEDFLFETYCCAPNYAQELVIFEAEDFITIDKCAWYDRIRKKNYEIDDTVVNPENKRFVEYVVPDIKNILFRMPVDIKNYYPKFEDLEMINPYLDAIFDIARKYQQNIYTINKIGQREKVDTNKHPRFLQLHKNINVETGVFPIMYSLVIKHDPFDFTRFQGQKAHEVYSLFIDWTENDCTEEGLTRVRKRFDGLFEKNFDIVKAKMKNKKISRNDPCPCGSGKKYKKCCGFN